MSTAEVFRAGIEAQEQVCESCARLIDARAADLFAGTGCLGLEALSRGAAKAVFCDVDQIPAALADWQAGGYQVRRVVPLDMFPGAANLEVLVLLAPAAAGRTGRRG